MHKLLRRPGESRQTKTIDRGATSCLYQQKRQRLDRQARRRPLVCDSWSVEQLHPDRREEELEQR
ncbi:hypothetical protein J6590_045896 [Homalodisca vitripennis]|nr:hypothetical protein J6590_045896 [Homalodisca vitripennis]